MANSRTEVDGNEEYLRQFNVPTEGSKSPEVKECLGMIKNLGRTAEFDPLKHYNNFIDRISGRIPLDIPDDVIARIRGQLYCSPVDRGMEMQMRALKALNLHQYYDHVYEVSARLRGKTAYVDISDEEKVKFMDVAKGIYELWKTHKSEDRHNFLPHTDLFSMSWKILGRKEYIEM
jgi:hypothetical protein